MSEIFYDSASIDYPIIDSDSHVNEPPDLWQERVPSKYKQRAPKVLHTEHGDFWSFEDGKVKRPVGLTATAGLSWFQFKPFGVTYESMRPGSFDTDARLGDLNADGIYAQVLYPSVTLSGARAYTDDRDLQLCCVRAYNEWLNEFCDGSDGRLIPLGIIPTSGIDDAVAELEWSMKNGQKGVVISAFPNGTLDVKPEDDRFWSIVEEAGYPVSVHIGSFLPSGGGPKRDIDWKSLRFLGTAAATKAGWQTLGVVCDILFSGIFEAHPKLKIVLVEANIGWIPTVLEQSDDMFRRYRWYSETVEQMSDMPSDIFHRNFWATFMIDTVGMDLRHRLNVDHLMWSTDYPHSGSDWPNSRISLERVFRGVEREQVKRMIHTNCKKLYKLDHIPDVLPDRAD